MSHEHKLPLLARSLIPLTTPTWPKPSHKLRDALISSSIDGVTINKRPMINAMMASSYNPQSLFNVINCSNHIANMSITDACYLPFKYIPVRQKSDPNDDWYDLDDFVGT